MRPTRPARRPRSGDRPLLRRQVPPGAEGDSPERIIEVVLADLPQQGAGADAEELRRPLAVAPGLRQAPLDRLALEVEQGHPRADLLPRVARRIVGAET